MSTRKLQQQSDNTQYPRFLIKPASSRNMTLFQGASWPRENVVLTRVSVLEQNRVKLKTRCNSSDAFKPDVLR